MAKGLGTKLVGAALVGVGAGFVEQARRTREDALLALRRQWQTEDREASEAMTREGWDRQDARTAAGREATAALTREGWDRQDARADSALVPTIDPATGSAVYTPTSEAAGRGVPGKKSQERMVAVTDPQTGKAVFVPASMAAGMEPAPSDRRPERLYPLEDPMTGAVIGYQTREEALAGQQAGADGGGESDEATLERAATARKNLGPAWTETDYWNPAVSSEKWLGASDEEFDQRLAARIRQSPNVPDDELARQLAAELTGQQQGGGDGGQAPAPTGEQPPANHPPAQYPNARQAADGNWYVPAGEGQWRRVQ